MYVMPSIPKKKKKDTHKSAVSLNLGRERERLLLSIAIMKCEMQT